ncbi:MAG: oligosaccharide flippase family protein, partial [Clostridia bacterium]|nr:oligosaccharide flippase family protein [Clostridia bacterium]
MKSKMDEKKVDNQIDVEKSAAELDDKAISTDNAPQNDAQSAGQLGAQSDTGVTDETSGALGTSGTGSNETPQNIMGKTASGMLWKFCEKIGSQVMLLIIQIVLARLLMPEEYGLVGLLTIFISISDVFILQGLTTAHKQNKNADDTDFSSVFYANIVISVVLYAILFAVSPLVAKFYKEPALTSIMRVLSLNIIIGAIPAVHNAVLSRNLDFRKSFFRNISNVLTQGVVGISLAFLGWGAWSMVFSKIA